MKTISHLISRNYHGIRSVLICVPLFWLFGCGRDQDDLGSYQKMDQVLRAHDFKAGNPKAGAKLVPPVIEFLKPKPGTRIHPTENIDLVVRLRLVPGSRVPTFLDATVRNGNGSMVPFKRAKKDGNDYICETTFYPQSQRGGAWTPGKMEIVVSMTDIEVVKKADDTADILRSPWMSEALRIEVERK